MEIFCPLVQFRSGQICKGRRNTGDETQEITAGDEHFGDVCNSYNCLVDLGFLWSQKMGDVGRCGCNQSSASMIVYLDLVRRLVGLLVFLNFFTVILSVIITGGQATEEVQRPNISHNFGMKNTTDAFFFSKKRVKHSRVFFSPPG